MNVVQHIKRNRTQATLIRKFPNVLGDWQTPLRQLRCSETLDLYGPKGILKKNFTPKNGHYCLLFRHILCF